MWRNENLSVFFISRVLANLINLCMLKNCLSLFGMPMMERFVAMMKFNETNDKIFSNLFHENPFLTFFVYNFHLHIRMF